MSDYSTYCYEGSAEQTCELNIKPYCIEQDCLPQGYYDFTDYCDDVVSIGVFGFQKWHQSKGGSDYWVATATGTDGNDVISGNQQLIDLGIVASALHGTYFTDNVYFHISGGAGDDTITGSANADQLNGDSGNDLLNGLGGDDQLNGGDGDDTAHGGDGNDYVGGGSGTDTVNGDAGDDSVSGGYGSDAVNGGDGNDNLFGDTDDYCGYIDRHGNYYAPESVYDGADVMDGGAGDDRMFGQGGDDVMLGGLGNDGMDGGSGNDNMRGGDGIDNMTGGSGDDVMKGDAGHDIMNGGDGSDVMYGGSGKDWIAGGQGDDELTGNGGKDHFVFCDVDGCDGDDYISDFTTTRQRDQIDLTQLHSLDLVISSETGEATSAFLELICFGDDGQAGGGDDYTLGTIYIDSLQNIGRVFDLDSTFGTSVRSLVRVDAGVLIDLPSDSYVYDGELLA